MARREGRRSRSAHAANWRSTFFFRRKCYEMTTAICCAALTVVLLLVSDRRILVAEGLGFLRHGGADGASSFAAFGVAGGAVAVDGGHGHEPPSWPELESLLGPSLAATPPTTVIDSALDPSPPQYSPDRPTLFRERHGWCPYSERVWLALEYKNVEYDTIKIDNTGPGVKPPYFRGGQTPQMRWHTDGSVQGESMDLVRRLDELYPDSPSLYRPDGIAEEAVECAIDKFRAIFPRGARPSSRAAFLFTWSGEPLFRSDFEGVLRATDDLLAEADGGPYFCGEHFTAADVAWAPFLERYRAQLPCLHPDLRPDDARSYPNLARWYMAMEQHIAAYKCRVMGDAESWRRVLTMAGFGNAGNVPDGIAERMQIQRDVDRRRRGAGGEEAEAEKVQALWDRYIQSRPHIAETPSREAAAIMVRNRKAIALDCAKRGKLSTVGRSLPQDEAGLDRAARALVSHLLGWRGEGRSTGVVADCDSDCIASVPGVKELAAFLDDRLCVPRDMGEPSGRALRSLAAMDDA